MVKQRQKGGRLSWGVNDAQDDRWGFRHGRIDPRAATGKTTVSNKGIGVNKNSSGGLHRATHAPILA